MPTSTYLEFFPGDTVRTTRTAHGGDVLAGTWGRFIRYESIRDYLGGPGDRRTVAVVDFGAFRPGETIVAPNVLTRVTAIRPQGLPVNTDAKAERLSRAHEAVGKAYRDLAYALNDLKAVEAS